MLAPPTRPAMSVSAPRIVALRVLRKSFVIEYLVKLLPLLRKRWSPAAAILGPPPLWIINPVEQIVRRERLSVSVTVSGRHGDEPEPHHERAGMRLGRIGVRQQPRALEDGM